LFNTHILYRYIAVEFAGIYNGMGSKVNLFYRREAPLRYTLSIILIDVIFLMCVCLVAVDNTMDDAIINMWFFSHKFDF
jgi:hypothetical protein